MQLDRREFLLSAARLAGTVGVAGAIASSVSCSSGVSDGTQSVVVYTSADGEVADPILDAFTRETGIRVDAVRDTEATKTTGLVRRLLDERAIPKAHLFWSNEALAIARLQREGMLRPLPDGLTHATLASRARVIVFDTRMVARGTPPPTGLGELLSSAFKGRLGIAKPQFGTTRAHVSAIRQAVGRERFEEWCKAMRDAGVRQYTGNSSVVRAVADGEIAAGLTDTDDVWAGKRNNWPVEMAYPRDAELIAAPILIPNTVALIKNDAAPANAIRLVDFLRGESVERLMVESELKHIPKQRSLLDKFPDRMPAGAAEPDWAVLDAVSDEAISVWEQIVGV